MIDVAFTRKDLRSADITVVVDVLRATSTAAQALASGYQRVIFADSIDGARALRGPGRILAGERECVMPEGFDQGNSPLEATRCRGDELVLATSNGAPTIVAAASHAPTVLLAALLNFDAVVAALHQDGPWSDRDLQIVCSGTGADTAFEDVYVAGRLSARLAGPRSDAAHVAEAIAAAQPSALSALRVGGNAAVLVATGSEDDITYCARESRLDVVPQVVDAGPGVATIVAAGATVPAMSDPPDQLTGSGLAPESAGGRPS